MTSLTELATLLVVGWLSYEWYRFRVTLKKVEHIPTVGSDTFLGAYIGAWKFFIYGRTIIEEGYKKYPGGLFKVATFETANRWLIVGSGPKFAEDIRRAGDDLVDINEPIVENLKMDWTLGAGKDMAHRHSAHHLATIRGPMTRNIGVRFDDVQDEVATSFKEYIPATEEWTSHLVQDTLIHIVTRATNRFFVGLPYCRNREYITAMEKFAVKMLVSAYAINLSPPFIRPIVARIVGTGGATLNAMKTHLGPMIEERLKEGSEKPNDMITWLIDASPEHFRTVKDVLLRLLISNFAAIHTTTITLSELLFYLAAHPECIPALRAEIEDVVARYGWAKDAMARLHKLDSFMKEVNRMAGVNTVVGIRQTKKDFTFSNGVLAPEGFTISTASQAQHYDPELYADPETFDANRFLSGSLSEGAEKESEGPKSKQMVAVDTTYVLFGVGRHACPGRFFAVNELKTMAGYVLMNYDIKLADDSNVPPAGMYFGRARSANPTAHILFRKRQN